MDLQSEPTHNESSTTKTTLDWVKSFLTTDFPDVKDWKKGRFSRVLLSASSFKNVRRL